jgi:DNA invertase Pin-like site-specific DNA recombinase
MFRAGLYARVSTNDQQTLAMQNRAMREYAVRRGWTIALQVREVNSGAAKREARQNVLEAARRREIDLVLVLATGPLGPVRNRSTGNLPRTGAPRSGLRFPD